MNRIEQMPNLERFPTTTNMLDTTPENSRGIESFRNTFTEWLNRWDNNRVVDIIFPKHEELRKIAEETLASNGWHPTNNYKGEIKGVAYSQN